MAEATFFRDIVLVLVAALLGAGIARLVRAPLFVGYVIAGLLISPFTPGPAIRDVATFELFAQIGVVLLMFSIGIEFSLHEMTRLGAPALAGAPIVIVLVIALATAAGVATGLPVSDSAAVGMVISVSSTMVLAKLLVERGELHAPHARLAIGTALAEDLMVVALIVLVPVLAGGPGRFGAIALALGRAVLVLLPVFLLANRVVPQLLARVARGRNMEVFILVAVLIGVGTAALSQGLGLSLALGAFLGGLIISESEFTHEVLTRILPMRDVFGVLFFVSVGTLIRPQGLVAELPLLLLLVSLIVVGKFGLRLLVLRAFRYPWATAALVSIHMAQTGEFSFVLAQVARDAGALTDSLYHALLAASLLSILVAALAAEVGHRWVEEPVGPIRAAADGDGDATPPGRVLICGFGRVGSTIGEALETFRIPFTVVDLDFTVIEALRRRGVPCVFGDAASVTVLRRAGAETATLAVVATPDFERNRLAVRRIREINPQVSILARASSLPHREALLEAGATDVIQPELEAAQTLIRHGLEQMGVPHEQVKVYMEQQRAAATSESPEARSGRALLQTRVIRVGPGLCADRSLRQARIRERTGVSILAVRRQDGTLLPNPSPDTILREGDEVTAIGLSDQLARFELFNTQGVRSE